MNRLLIASLVLVGFVVLVQSQGGFGRQGQARNVEARREGAAAQRANRLAAREERQARKAARISARQEKKTRLAAQEAMAGEEYANNKAFIDFANKEAINKADKTQVLINDEHILNAISDTALSAGEADNYGLRVMGNSGIDYAAYDGAAVDAEEEYISNDGTALDYEGNEAMEIMGLQQADQGLFGQQENFFGGGGGLFFGRR